MKKEEYIKMLKSKKKKATRRDELREFIIVEVPNKDDNWCKIEWFVNIATRKRFVTKHTFYPSIPLWPTTSI